MPFESEIREHRPAMIEQNLGQYQLCALCEMSKIAFWRFVLHDSEIWRTFRKQKWLFLPITVITCLLSSNLIMFYQAQSEFHSILHINCFYTHLNTTLTNGLISFSSSTNAVEYVEVKYIKQKSMSANRNCFVLSPPICAVSGSEELNSSVFSLRNTIHRIYRDQ